MAALTIRNLDEAVKRRLRLRAAAMGRSMEEEARQILKDALDKGRPQSLADWARSLFGSKHGVNLEPHPVVRVSAPPDFGSS